MRWLVIPALCALPFAAGAEDVSLTVGTIYAIGVAGGGDRHVPQGDPLCEEVFGGIDAQEVTGSYDPAGGRGELSVAGETVPMMLFPDGEERSLFVSDLTPQTLMDQGVAQILLTTDTDGVNPRVRFELRTESGEPQGVHCYLADRLPD